MTFFSIIIPTFNRVNTLKVTLDSIVGQSFDDYEIILVDDGSTDCTEEYALAFEKKNASINFRYYKKHVNRGCNYAKNYGVTKSSGQYLVFLDSDDRFLEPNTLQGVFDVILFNSLPSLLMFSCQSKTGEKLSSNPAYNGFLNYTSHFKGEIIGEYLPVVKTKDFKEVFFFEEIVGGEHLTWWKISKISGSIYYSSYVARLYDDLGSDRLSVKNEKFYNRVYQIYKLDLRQNWKDYLKFNKKGIILISIKLLYYKLLT